MSDGGLISPLDTAEGTLMRNLLAALDRSDLIERSHVGRETSVDAEDATIDKSSEGEVVKHLAAVLPCVGVAVL